MKYKTHITKEYGVPCSTLSMWFNNKDAFRKAHGNFALVRKRLRNAKHSNVKAALLMRSKDARSSQISISGYILREKAKEYALPLKIIIYNCMTRMILFRIFVTAVIIYAFCN